MINMWLILSGRVGVILQVGLSGRVDVILQDGLSGRVEVILQISLSGRINSWFILSGRVDAGLSGNAANPGFFFKKTRMS